MKRMLMVMMLLGLFILNGCARFDPLRGLLGSYRNYTHIDGTIKDGVYYDPCNRFTLKVPCLMKPGAVIQGVMKENYGYIVFYDDLGTLIRLDVGTVSTDEDRAYMHSPGTAYFDASRELQVARCQQAVPGAALIHQEYLDLGLIDADYFVLSMPRGHTLASASGRRLDALRGFLCFIRGDTLYVLSTQEIDSEKKDKTSPSMKNTLTGFVKDMSFSY